MDLQQFNTDLLTFLQSSPTPFHAVETMTKHLQAAGFSPLQEGDDWPVPQAGSAYKYYIVRNDSSIVAVNGGGQSPVSSGFRMVGAHTDSPCLKVKPQPELNNKGYFQLGVEVYGGALLNPWFDRDLSLAGRVSYQNDQGQLCSALIDFERAIAVIPSLAIHLDREANSKRAVNAQKDIPPLLMRSDEPSTDFRELLLAQLTLQHPAVKATKILDYELSFYDVQPPAVIGLKDEFIASARLDNLLSCYIGLQALLTAGEQNCVLVCNDHEEVGSQSSAGAQGPMLKSVLRRLLASESDFVRAMDSSVMISVDNAHGVHPNFSDKHDGNHGPILNQGAVIKINANQRYASNSETSSLFRHWSEAAGQPVQAFVVRSDMGCGSTIGPITAGELGVKTVDIGVPTFAMHSIRELAGSQDAYSLFRVLEVFNQAGDMTVS
ncbi:M18 family aminopeptidase [Oceanicoccus sagamiensis]|uniref:M18 family aminopeptidase n=1 Tax=Oceanicoccus sagamiensis TaxID=716816 RepID=A0A1X9NBF4_9GAMM|nr:M18 family aminopeptidase [Oceanicoccus sagamiensis]ARN75368.1 M18 family aminopeptidase [Oceanicoccus sagamiensis]